jgi:NADH-quinone oxidoreductase subunit D
VRQFLRVFPARIDEYEALLTKNPLFLDRTQGIGVLSPEDAIKWGVTGPILRASGVAHDLRKVNAYSGYEMFEFDVATQTAGDTYARYLVRVEEMRQSVRIVQQALDRMPAGPVRGDNRKFVLSPAFRAGYQHGGRYSPLRLWTEGQPPPGSSTCHQIAAWRARRIPGERWRKPAIRRVHWRTPSFCEPAGASLVG